MALEPIETAQLWVATLAGLAGLAGLLWQIYEHFIGRKEESNWKLNRNVLKPWSDLKINNLYENDQRNRIALVIPKEALPSDVVPSTGEQGREVKRLPGLSKGEAFLRRHYPEVFSKWAEVTRLQRRYDSLLERRRNTVEPIVREGMSKAFPGLRAVWSWTDFGMNSYALGHIIADIEAIGYWAAKDGEVRLQIQMSKTQADVLYLEYRAGSQPWLRTPEVDGVGIKTFEALVTTWITAPEVVKANKDLFDIFAKLEKAIDKFQTALKEASVNVELEGE